MGLILLLDLKVGKDGWNCKIVQYSRRSSVKNGDYDIHVCIFVNVWRTDLNHVLRHFHVHNIYTIYLFIHSS